MSVDPVPIHLSSLPQELSLSEDDTSSSMESTQGSPPLDSVRPVMLQECSNSAAERLCLPADDSLLSESTSAPRPDDELSTTPLPLPSDVGALHLLPVRGYDDRIHSRYRPNALSGEIEGLRMARFPTNSQHCRKDTGESLRPTIAPSATENLDSTGQDRGGSTEEYPSVPQETHVHLNTDQNTTPASLWKVGVISFHEHKIRNETAYTRWFETRGEYSLPSAPSQETRMRVGDLFLHLHREGAQVWVFGSNKVWVPAQRGHPHPFLPQHCLDFLPSGQPRWVTRKTQTTYRSRRP